MGKRRDYAAQLAARGGQASVQADIATYAEFTPPVRAVSTLEDHDRLLESLKAYATVNGDNPDTMFRPGQPYPDVAMAKGWIHFMAVEGASRFDAGQGWSIATAESVVRKCVHMVIFFIKP